MNCRYLSRWFPCARTTTRFGRRRRYQFLSREGLLVEKLIAELSINFVGSIVLSPYEMEVAVEVWKSRSVGRNFRVWWMSFAEEEGLREIENFERKGRNYTEDARLLEKLVSDSRVRLREVIDGLGRNLWVDKGW